MKDSKAIHDRLLQHIADASDEAVLPADLRPETSLRDELDLSSMQAITLIMDLEEEFDIVVDDEELEGLQTVGDVTSLLDAKLNGRAS